ncbi:guanylate kinase [bacterium]|nr:guanylate kinase [bacterium]
MSEFSKGLLVVISAPSGAGKTTLAHELLRRIPDSRRSLSSTTRPPRQTEIPGQDYDFISDEEFDALEKKSDFAESAVVHGYRYGTKKSTIQEALDRKQALILTIDVQGATSIKENFPDSLCIFVEPPDFDVLETRLRKRGTESDSDIRRRLENARREIALKDQFNFVVVNDRLDRAALEIESIIRKTLSS